MTTELDNDFDLDFFADDDEQPAQENQDNKVNVDKDEYELMKQQAEAQRQQAAAEAARAQPAPAQSQTAELDAYIDQRASQLFEQKKAAFKEEVTWEQAANTAKQKHADIAGDPDALAWVGLKADKIAEEAARTGNVNKFDVLEKAVQAYRKMVGQQPAQQDKSRIYGMMNPDVRGSNQQPKSKVTAEKILTMSSDKFEELDRKVQAKFNAGERVVF